MYIDECIHLSNIFFSLILSFHLHLRCYSSDLRDSLSSSPFVFCLSLSILFCASDSNSNLLCLCWELLKAWLYTVPFLFFKYNYFFTHSPRITFQRRRENPIRTWFLLSLSRQCQSLECWSQKYFIPASFIKFSGQIEHVWYRDLIESWRLPEMLYVSHAWSEQQVSEEALAAVVKKTK